MRFEHWVYTLPLRLRSLFRRNRVEQELDEEIESHLERQIQENLARGMSAEEARYAALRSMGGVAQRKEECRDARRVRIIEDLLQDLSYAARILRRNRSFAAVAALTLALGIGANTTIFTLINTVLLRPLPYKDPDNLLMVWQTNQKQGIRHLVSPADFFDFQDSNQVFEEVSALYPPGFNLTGAGEPERLNGARASASIFPMFGITPILGRTFTPREDRPGAERTTVISYSLWQKRFSGDAGIIGKTVVLSGNGYTIVGVLPEAFRTTGIFRTPDVWVPIGLDPNQNRRGARYLRVYGRLKPGVTLNEAQAEMQALAGQLALSHPETNAGIGVALAPLHEQVVGQVRPALLMLLGAAGLLLLIACANVGNLLLQRAVERRTEIAVRLALGAGRGRLIRQLLTEVGLLFLIGGALGFLLAFWSNDALVALINNRLPRAGEIGMDRTVSFFALGLSLLSGLLFGLAPALQAASVRLAHVIKGGHEGATHRLRFGVRDWLVVSEIALSALLLIGAGLLVQAFVRLRQVDPGFNPDNVLNTRISLPSARYPSGRGISSFNQQLIEQVQNLPGVQAAAVTDFLPLGDTGGATTEFTVGGAKDSAEFRVVSPGYFRALEVPLKKGRNFLPSDTAASPPVFIISEAAARRFWPAADPVGARLTVRAEQPVTGEVVGIVGNVKHYALNEDPAPVIYATHTQPPWMNRETRELVVRTAGNPLALSDGVRRAIWALEKDVPITGFLTLDDLLSRSVAQPAFYAFLVAIFAGFALALGAIGIYGVVSYWVGQRTHEIAIRVALGAGRYDSLKLILRQGGTLAGIGIAIGLAAAFLLTRFLSRLLYQVSATDPSTFIIVPVFLMMIAFWACYLPARRASRVDPMTVLRHE